MMNYSALFPWRRLEKGQGFFIPCVNTEEVRLAGLNEALRQRVFGVKAYAAIKDGLMGVWFYR
jgi:hypothetical protein